MDGGEHVRILPVTFGLKGEVTLRKRNVVTGEVDVRKVRNLLLANFFDRFFERGPGIQTTNTMYRCRLGTDNTPPTIYDQGLKGTELANSTSGVTTTAWHIEDHKAIYGRTWTFAPGVGTGTLGEIVLQTASSDATYYDVANNWVARVAIDPPYEKGPNDELAIDWVLIIDKGGPSWSGQIDGTVWTVTMNNRQFLDFCQTRGSGGVYMYSSLKAWVHTSNVNPRIRVGSSNAPSDLENDTYNTIKGDELFLAAAFRNRVPLAYTPGSFYRDIIVRLEPYEPDGTIGELVLYDSSYSRAFCRITFTPPFAKPAPYRLDLTLRISLVQEGQS